MANPRPAPAIPDNATIAARPNEYAGLPELQGDDRFRIRAYQEAGVYIMSLRQPLREVFAKEGTSDPMPA